MRHGALGKLTLVPRGSVAWFFFDRLKHAAEGDVRRQQERDEELFDE